MSNLQDTDGLIQNGLGVGVVVGAGQLDVAEVALEQEVRFGRGLVHHRVRQRDGAVLGQILVHQVLVVTNRQLIVLLGVAQHLHRKTVEPPKEQECSRTL